MKKSRQTGTANLLPSRRNFMLAAAMVGLATQVNATQADATDSNPGFDETLDPALPIIDPHHHLIDFGPHAPPGSSILSPYLFDQVLADMQSGHNIRASVIVGGAGFARTTGPVEFRNVGDTEFSDGAAAQSASGKYGAVRIGAGLVGEVDLTLGSRVRPVLEAHIQAGGGRFRGVRHMTVWTDDPKLVPPGKMAARDLAFHPDFQAGFAELERLDLSFDAWCYFTQLDGIAVLAKRFPRTTIIMNHCGGPLGAASWASKRDEAFAAWRIAVKNLAQYPNVVMKLGGLGMWTTGLPSVGAKPPASAAEIAREQRPYLEVCIDAFGPQRAMFESNYPVEAGVGRYHTVWNAFKLVAQNWSGAEKTALFSETAARAYRIELES